MIHLEKEFSKTTINHCSCSFLSGLLKVKKCHQPQTGKYLQEEKQTLKLCLCCRIKGNPRQSKSSCLRTFSLEFILKWIKMYKEKSFADCFVPPQDPTPWKRTAASRVFLQRHYKRGRTEWPNQSFNVSDFTSLFCFYIFHFAFTIFIVFQYNVCASAVVWMRAAAGVKP